MLVLPDMVDLKPQNLEELTNVITTASFHPLDCSSMIYGLSSGSVRLADLRESASCEHHSKRMYPVVLQREFLW